ncbi:hypothetical protein C2E23DRAFT_735966 [Lenzites betulinus]|nr:hypothetical protein C2E23DRAFT_735966 [Lenzites betulinus]
MPELDILQGFEFLALKSKENWKKHHWDELKAHIEIFPRAFALGTSNKAYITCTVDQAAPFDYNPSLEPIPEGYISNTFDASKSKGKPFEHYLKPHEAGELFVKSRGKEIVYACGYHALRLHFGLEGTAIAIPTASYLELISRDCPGTNTDPRKAAQMRSFVVPPQLLVTGARQSQKTQSLAVFAAIVGPQETFIMIDHNRLLRIHIMSLSRHWEAKDFDPDSQMWQHLWSDNHGPDWVYETAAAGLRLDAWRASVLKQGQLDLTRSARSARSAHAPLASLLHTMLGNQELFNGYGQHTAHDLLHSLGLWPTTPPLIVCSDEDLYLRFKEALHSYAQQFSSDTYRKRCLSQPNHSSSIVFNYMSDDNYHNQYLKVFRKSSVRLTQEEYNMFARQGLFNPSHTIGMEPYNCMPEELIRVKTKEVPVYIYTRGRGDPIYTVITARRPASWRHSDSEPAVKQSLALDARDAGFSTTLGPASFDVFKKNQFDWRQQGKPGRKPKIYTGKPGRPARAVPPISDLRHRSDRGKKAQKRVVSQSAGMPLDSDFSAELPPPKRICRTSRLSMLLPTERKTRSSSSVIEHV